MGSMIIDENGMTTDLENVRRKAEMADELLDMVEMLYDYLRKQYNGNPFEDEMDELIDRCKKGGE